MAPQRILIISTPVGPLGSGVGGGVELTLHSLVLGLTGRGHHVEVLAPEQSLHVGTVVHQIKGALQPSAHSADRDTLVTVPADGVLAAMCEWARVHQDEFDVILNLAYDWLPYYLTPFFVTTPLAHLVSMATLSDAMDDAIVRAAALRPRNVAMHSQAQADTFPALRGPTASGLVPVVGSGVAVERYDMHITADEPPHLGFIGRISEEKGLDDVVAVAASTGLPLKVWGLMQDRVGVGRGDDRPSHGAGLVRGIPADRRPAGRDRRLCGDRDGAEVGRGIRKRRHRSDGDRCARDRLSARWAGRDHRRRRDGLPRRARRRRRTDRRGRLGSASWTGSNAANESRRNIRSRPSRPESRRGSMR